MVFVLETRLNEAVFLLPKRHISATKTCLYCYTLFQLKGLDECPTYIPASYNHKTLAHATFPSTSQTVVRRQLKLFAFLSTINFL